MGRSNTARYRGDAVLGEFGPGAVGGFARARGIALYKVPERLEPVPTRGILPVRLAGAGARRLHFKRPSHLSALLPLFDAVPDDSRGCGIVFRQHAPLRTESAFLARVRVDSDLFTRVGESTARKTRQHQL